MILARLSRAVREQNWFAVAIEFVIVIAGVVIGFQITAWNGERSDRNREQACLARLHDEVLDAEANRLGLLESVSSRVEMADSIVGVLFEGGDPADLPDAACEAIVRIGIFYLEGYALPTLDELMSTGNLGIIRNDRLRERLTAYRSFVDSTADRFGNIQRDMPNLPRDYPHLVSLAPSRSADRIAMSAGGCDYEGMRASDGFRNDYIDTLARSGFFRRNALEAEDRHFRAIHEALDAVLGEHGDTTE